VLKSESSAPWDGVRGSPEGWLPGTGDPVGVACPSGPIAKAGSPGGGGIKPSAMGAASGIISIPEASVTHSGQNLMVENKSVPRISYMVEGPAQGGLFTRSVRLSVRSYPTTWW